MHLLGYGLANEQAYFRIWVHYSSMPMVSFWLILLLVITIRLSLIVLARGKEIDGRRYIEKCWEAQDLQNIILKYLSAKSLSIEFNQEDENLKVSTQRNSTEFCFPPDRGYILIFVQFSKYFVGKFYLVHFQFCHFPNHSHFCCLWNESFGNIWFRLLLRLPFPSTCPSKPKLSKTFSCNKRSKRKTRKHSCCNFQPQIGWYIRGSLEIINSSDF